ncbi:hypothetical protein BDW69DRAFT_181509 [Aspergillus filifer]
MAERDPSRAQSFQTPSGEAVPPEQFPARRPSIGDEVTQSRSMSTGSDDSNATGNVLAGELIADHGDSMQLDMTLDRIIKISKRLNNVLLIDEADVFMKKRASYQGSDNRLVTVFLRKLEYYEGVLFLATNRVMEFDEAVLSRIHLNMKNLLSIAQALASVENTKVTFMHSVKATKASDRFVEEFKNSGQMQGMYT